MNSYTAILPRSRKLLPWLTVALLAGVLGLPAQTSPTPTPSAAAPRQPADERIVLNAFQVSSERDYGYRSTNSITATRTPRPILETPISISVVTEEFLRDTAGTASLFDATRYIAAIAGEPLSDPASRGTLGRGVGAVRGFPVDAILRNGVARRGGFSFDNVQRIEVLKGPVSVLFGSAQPGGTINYITKAPEFKRTTELSFSFSDYISEWASDSSSTSGYKGSLRYNDSIKDKVAYSIFLSGGDRGGWRDREYFRDSTIAPSILFKPFRGLSLLVEYERFRFDSNPAGTVAQGNPQFALDYFNPPASVLAANNLTAAQYRSAIFGNSTRWRDLWLTVLGDSGDVLSRNRLYRTTALGKNSVAVSLPTTRPSYSFQGDGHYSDTLNDSFNAELVYEPADWLKARLAHVDNVNRWRWITTFRSEINGDYTYNVATGNANNERHRATNTQLDLLFTVSTGPVKHQLLLGGEIYENRSRTAPGVFDYSTASPVVAADGTVLRGAPAIQRWDPVLHGNPPDSARYFVRWGNIVDTSTSNYGRYLQWQGEYEVLGRKLIGSYGVRREHAAVRTATSILNSRGPSESMGLTFEIVRGVNGYVSKNTNYRPNAPGFPGGGLSADGVGVNRDTAGNLVPGLTEQRLLADQVGEGIDFGFKFQSSDGKWSGSIGWYRLERSNIRLQDQTRTTNDPRNVFGSFYPQQFNPDGTPNRNTLRQVDAGFVPVRFFESSGVQRNEGIEVDLVWTPRSNYQAYLSFAQIYTSKTVTDPSLTGAARYDVLNSGRRLPYAPKYTVGVFNKYTFTQGGLKGLSVGAGVNGKTAQVQRAGFADIADLLGGGFAADINLSYRSRIFDRPATYSLTARNVFDRLYLVGGGGYADPRQLTFRIDSNF